MVQFDGGGAAAGLLLPLAQTITVSLSGFGILLVLMAIGAYAGYQQGLRNILTVALWTILAYILTVQGGDFIVEVINRIWVNGPRLVAFLINNDPNSAPALDPLIATDFQVPLFFRFVAFIALVLVGTFFNNRSSWRGQPKEALARPLGLFVGALIMLLWTNALVVFWSEFVFEGGTLAGPASPLATVLNTLPDISVFMPSLIAIFFLILLILIVFNFPKVWKPEGGGGGGKR
jgi:hypothetical protein